MPDKSPDPEQQNGRPVRGSQRRKYRLEHAGQLSGEVISQSDWQQLCYVDKPTEPLDDEGVERIHQAAVRVLQEIGINFLNQEAQQILADAGCTVERDSGRVRMDGDFAMEQIALIPSSFTITPRNPERTIEIGGRKAVCGPVSSPPNCSDMDNGRRRGNRADYQNLLKLSQYFNCIHFIGGYGVEPVDIHASIRHLDAFYDKLTLTDKAVHAYSLGTARVEDAMEMTRIATGLTPEEFNSKPRMFTNINSSSPLKHDWPMLDGAMRFARRGQPTVIAPFTMAGAMAPVTIAGALVQQIAEFLCAAVLLQLVKPGSPVVMGAFTTNVDMKSGAPCFGTPEYMRAMQISGQMARRYGIPWRGSNACAANAVDSQAIWESMFSLWGVTSGQANIIYHGAGWLEGGLCASFEKFVIDCEVLQQLTYYHQEVPTTDADLAVEAIREVGPDGHFLSSPHTRERYRTAFYSSFLADLRNYERWYEEGGGLSVEHAANRIYKEIIANFEPPPLDSAIREELEAFVARRKEEGGAPTDF